MTATRRRLQAAKAVTLDLDLAAVPGIVGLWDARDITVADGEKVAVWPDGLGGGNDMVQPDPTHQPVFRNGDSTNLLPAASVATDLSSGIRLDTGQSMPDMPLGTPFFTGCKFNSTGFPDNLVRITFGAEAWGGYGFYGGLNLLLDHPAGAVTVPPPGQGSYEVVGGGWVPHPNGGRVTQYRFATNPNNDPVQSGQHVYMTDAFVIPVQHRPGGKGNPRNILTPADTPDSGGLGSWTTDGDGHLANIPDPTRPGKRMLEFTSTGYPFIRQTPGAITGIVPGKLYCAYAMDQRTGYPGNVRCTVTWRDNTGAVISTPWVADFMGMGGPMFQAPDGAVAADIQISLESFDNTNGVYRLREIGFYEQPRFVAVPPQPIKTPCIRGGSMASAHPFPHPTDGFTWLALCRQDVLPAWADGFGMLFCEPDGGHGIGIGIEGRLGNNPGAVQFSVGGFPAIAGGILDLGFHVVSGAHSYDGVSHRTVGVDLDLTIGAPGADYGPGWGGPVRLYGREGFLGDVVMIALFNRYLPEWEQRQVIQKMLERVR